MSDEGHLPIGAVVLLAALLVAAFGWGVFAAGYAQAEEGWGRPVEYSPEKPRPVRRSWVRVLVEFIWNGIVHLPMFPTVVMWNIQNRFWMIGVILGLEACVLVGGSVMKRVERELQTPRRRR
jgi:hypothetical protein